MRLIFISDSHLAHRDSPSRFPVIPDGDILVHAGDATWMGTEEEIKQYADWFLKLPHRHKVSTAGNHDWLGQLNPALYREILKADNHYILIDESVELEGIKFYGSPFSPRFGNWAFPLNAGKDDEEKWAKIPNDTDILITHGPPLWIGDRCGNGDRAGSPALYKRVLEIRPKVHVFGHIHEAYGPYLANGERMRKPKIRDGQTLFLNAAICDLSYDPINKPFEVIYG